ncbi:hypothetical protein L6Q21_00080 [Sandaracinobacter sp. RS1-74]|uniref:hypothetical protein n=1 Tax=Sandaracinobacteroides sayramensis TaxID=2913411 RepID=UPI001EDBE36D|nr:hypothetical protein [Sandaracinobacteroides sayramensis]MCG2839373.1 hypothetical protein [Sandaracinobacteroides sayramensis]
MNRKDNAMRAIMTLAVALAATTAAPAFANAETCDSAPAKLRAIAATSDATAAKKAERNIALGEALCEARNRSEAVKKFNLAAKSLGTDIAAVMSPTASANVQ